MGEIRGDIEVSPKKMLALLLTIGCFLSIGSACTNHPGNSIDESQDSPTEMNGASKGSNNELETLSNGEVTSVFDTSETDTPNSDKTTIVCIGDSITEGVGVGDVERDSYPARLSKSLGDGYEVLNYGKSGATMCSSTTDLYKSHNWFSYSGKYAELKRRAKDIDVALIMLGTNDGNTDALAEIRDLLDHRLDEFQADYEKNLSRMVSLLRSGNKDVKIYLLTTPKCFRPLETYPTWEQTLENIVRPLQEQLAKKLSLEIYDMYSFTANTVTSCGFPDNLHPGRYGYHMIGRELARIVADIYHTELIPDEILKLSEYEETFDEVPDGTLFTKQEDTTVTIGNTAFQVRVKEDSSLTVQDGVLALTRSATNTDAFLDVLLDEYLIKDGIYTFEISLKASEKFNSRGAIFYVFECQFLKFSVNREITNNTGTILGKLPSDRFMKIELSVDSATGAYQIDFDGERVDSGTTVFKATSTFRPIHFFADGSGTLYLDSIKVSGQ